MDAMSRTGKQHVVGVVWVTMEPFYTFFVYVYVLLTSLTLCTLSHSLTNPLSLSLTNPLSPTTGLEVPLGVQPGRRGQQLRVQDRQLQRQGR